MDALTQTLVYLQAAKASIVVAKDTGLIQNTDLIQQTQQIQDAIVQYIRELEGVELCA